MDLGTRLLGLAEQQHSLVTRRQVAQLGGTRHTTTHLFDDHPRWEAITDQVLRLRGSVPTRAQGALAAVLDAGPGARLSHLSGGNRWGLSCSLTPIHVVTTSSSRRRTTLATVHKIRDLPDTWTTVLDGIPIVQPEFLALQIFSVCREPRAIHLVEHLWSLRLFSGRSLAAFLSQLGERGRNGTAGLRRYLDERGLDYVPPATGLERRVLAILGDAGFPMRRQVDSGGETWTGRVDLRHERLPLIVEVQSDRYHRALSFRAHDAARRAQLERDGFSVTEVWEDEVWTAPWQVVAKVRAKLHAATAASVVPSPGPSRQTAPQNG